MNILIFGDSDTSGRFSGGRSWPDMLRDSLGTETQEAIDLKSVGLSVVNDSAVGYVEKRLAEGNPDVIVLVLGSFGFTSKFTWLQVQHLFGKRAGAWYRRAEERFDSGTRSADGRPERVNRAARWLAGHLLKKRALSTRPKVTATYREIFRTLARAENAHVVVMMYPGIGKHARTGNAPQERAAFFAELKSVAETHHYQWLDTTGLFTDHNEHATRVDDLHFNAEGHERIASAVFGAIRAGSSQSP